MHTRARLPHADPLGAETWQHRGTGAASLGCGSESLPGLPATAPVLHHGHAHRPQTHAGRRLDSAQ